MRQLAPPPRVELESGPDMNFSKLPPTSEETLPFVNTEYVQNQNRNQNQLDEINENHTNIMNQQELLQQLPSEVDYTQEERDPSRPDYGGDIEKQKLFDQMVREEMAKMEEEFRNQVQVQVPDISIDENALPIDQNIQQQQQQQPLNQPQLPPSSLQNTKSDSALMPVSPEGVANINEVYNIRKPRSAAGGGNGMMFGADPMTEKEERRARQRAYRQQLQMQQQNKFSGDVILPSNAQANNSDNRVGIRKVPSGNINLPGEDLNERVEAKRLQQQQYASQLQADNSYITVPEAPTNGRVGIRKVPSGNINLPGEDLNEKAEAKRLQQQQYASQLNADNMLSAANAMNRRSSHELEGKAKIYVAPHQRTSLQIGASDKDTEKEKKRLYKLELEKQMMEVKERKRREKEAIIKEEREAEAAFNEAVGIPQGGSDVGVGSKVGGSPKVKQAPPITQPIMVPPAMQVLPEEAPMTVYPTAPKMDERGMNYQQQILQQQMLQQQYHQQRLKLYEDELQARAEIQAQTEARMQVQAKVIEREKMKAKIEAEADAAMKAELDAMRYHKAKLEQEAAEAIVRPPSALIPPEITRQIQPLDTATPMKPKPPQARSIPKGKSPPTKARMRLLSDVYGSSQFHDVTGHGDKVNVYSDLQKSPEKIVESETDTSWRPSIGATDKSKAFKIAEQKRILQEQIEERKRDKEREQEKIRQEELAEDVRVRAEIEVMNADERRAEQIRKAYEDADFKKVKELQIAQYKEALARRGRRHEVAGQLSPRDEESSPISKIPSPVASVVKAPNRSTSPKRLPGEDPYDPYGHIAISERDGTASTRPSELSEEGPLGNDTLPSMAGKYGALPQLPGQTRIHNLHPQLNAPYVNYPGLQPWQQQFMKDLQQKGPIAATQGGLNLGKVPMQQLGAPGAGLRLSDEFRGLAGAGGRMGIGINGMPLAVNNIPITPVDAQFANDSRLLPIQQAPTEGILGAFGMNEIDKQERAQHPSMHFLNQVQSGPTGGNKQRTHLSGVDPKGEPTFERSLASDSLLLYLGDKPKTPLVDKEEIPDQFMETFGVKSQSASQMYVKDHMAAPAHPERNSPHDRKMRTVEHEAHIGGIDVTL